jgi:hypothetical protein
MSVLKKRHFNGFDVTWRFKWWFKWGSMGIWLSQIAVSSGDIMESNGISWIIKRI